MVNGDDGYSTRCTLPLYKVVLYKRLVCQRQINVCLPRFPCWMSKRLAPPTNSCGLEAISCQPLAHKHWN